MNRRFRLHTLGCKANQYDSALIQEALERSGFVPAGDGQRPDVLVVNTCTVTAGTDHQNRTLIRKLRKSFPGALMVVTGCQAEVYPGVLEGMEGVDLVAPNSQKPVLDRLIIRALEGVADHGREAPTHASSWGMGVRRLPGRTRAFSKVQDGCEAFCAYCIVPHARGPSRSRPMVAVLEELRAMEGEGIQEVVLTGIRLGLYGRDLNPPVTLTELITEILMFTSIPRIRLSSIEPLEVDEALAGIMAREQRLCPHLHVPLQSGDDEILRLMNRPYSAAQYLERVRMALERVPALTLGCDVIAGFPGESAAHFERTVDFLDRLPYTYLHVFPFSARPGTPAHGLEPRVPAIEIRGRCRRLREMSRDRRSEVMHAQIGRVHDVLFEAEKRGMPGWVEGLTPTYLRVLSPGGRDLVNRIVPVRMDGVEGDHLVGRPVPFHRGR